MIVDVCQDKTSCLKSHCLTERTAFIYGLYDARLHDMFYVGSTFYPASRFSEHMKGAKKPYNTKSLWLRSILESGSYPLPILLYEFQSKCDQYTRRVEYEIARQLRAEGHTAICDAYEGPSEIVAYLETLPEPDWKGDDHDQQKAHNLFLARNELAFNLKKKWIERISEHAHVTAMLKEMFSDS